MTYASQSDLIAAYGEEELILATDRSEPPAGEIDADVVAAALSSADAEINSYLASRMTTPVSPVPAILKQRACEIARYRLWAARASDRVRTDYTDAIAWLRLVATGTVSLGDASGPTTPTSAGTPVIDAPSRKFTRKKLEGF